MTPQVGRLLQRLERGNRIARITMRCILAFNVWIALAWTFGDPSRSQTPVFTNPRQLLAGIGRHIGTDPARIWGAVLLVITLLGLLAMEGRSEGVTRGLIALLAGYWMFWFVIDIVSSFDARGSLTAAPTVGIILVGLIRHAIGTHLLTRRAVPRGD